jgi:hypothetical protein
MYTWPGVKLFINIKEKGHQPAWIDGLHIFPDEIKIEPPDAL